MLFMGYHTITSESSNQVKLRKQAKKDGKYKKAKPEYYALIDNRIVIATKEVIGGKLRVSVGSYVDVEFKGGKKKLKKKKYIRKKGKNTVYKCIIGEVKGKGATDNLWGHNGGKNVVEIVYHDYTPQKGYAKNKNDPWGKGKVIKITKIGKKYKYK